MTTPRCRSPVNLRVSNDKLLHHGDLPPDTVCPGPAIRCSREAEGVRRRPGLVRASGITRARAALTSCPHLIREMIRMNRNTWILSSGGPWNSARVMGNPRILVGCECYQAERSIGERADALLATEGCDRQPRFRSGGFGTPEHDSDDSLNTSLRFETPVEACQSIGDQSWGYRAGDDRHKDAHLVRSIQKVLAKGGNYLLKIGPMADGTMPHEGEGILSRIGQWYRMVTESLTQAQPASEMTTNRDVLLTRLGNVLFAHLIREPDLVDSPAVDGDRATPRGPDEHFRAASLSFHGCFANS